jgi:hypothetical protein
MPVMPWGREKSCVFAWNRHTRIDDYWRHCRAVIWQPASDFASAIGKRIAEFKKSMKIAASMTTYGMVAVRRSTLRR